MASTPVSIQTLAEELERHLPVDADDDASAPASDAQAPCEEREAVPS